jgi:putative acetyltransferase
MVIRETTAEELPQVLALYPLAFPDEELRPVVSGLIEGEAEVLSLAVFNGEALVAHVLFTIFSGEEDNRAGALLGPLGVVPDHQGQGVGNALVRDGLERLDTMGIRQVFVLGDPAYYGRFGFQPERQVLTPYSLPEELGDAWQSMLFSGRAPLAPGRCLLPASWMEPALWGP